MTRSSKRPNGTLTALGAILLSVGPILYLGLSHQGGDDSGQAPSEHASSHTSENNTCPIDTLPKEADEVVDAILAGGPFEHPDDDGSHFGNYEHRLPDESRNYYREYTVDTPGVGHRGARRIVVGGGSQRDPDTWYYTDDHYDSFCTIPDAEAQ